MQDTELVELIKSNPNQGLKILMDEYMGLLCTVVREKLHTVCDEFEMEACVSDVFVEFYNNIDRYTESKGSIKSYKSLGEPDSEIIIRKFYFGETSKQIAERLAMTVSAIDTRASRALKKLRKCVEVVV